MLIIGRIDLTGIICIKAFIALLYLWFFKTAIKAWLNIRTKTTNDIWHGNELENGKKKRQSRDTRRKFLSALILFSDQPRLSQWSCFADFVDDYIKKPVLRVCLDTDQRSIRSVRRMRKSLWCAPQMIWRHSTVQIKSCVNLFATWIAFAMFACPLKLVKVEEFIFLSGSDEYNFDFHNSCTTSHFINHCNNWW